jgi:hypothetical protein
MSHERETPKFDPKPQRREPEPKRAAAKEEPPVATTRERKPRSWIEGRFRQ